MGRARDPITGRFVTILEPALEAPVSTTTDEISVEPAEDAAPAVGDLVSFTLRDRVAGTETPGLVGLVLRAGTVEDPALRVLPLPGLGIEVDQLDVVGLTDSAV